MTGNLILDVPKVILGILCLCLKVIVKRQHANIGFNLLLFGWLFLGSEEY